MRGNMESYSLEIVLVLEIKFDTAGQESLRRGWRLRLFSNLGTDVGGF